MNNTGSIEVSVVIAAWNGASMLRQCLASLRTQTGAISSEVIVAHNFPFSPGMEETQINGLRFLEFPPETTVPLLRSRGLAAASGNVIAFAEDLCFFHPDWLVEVSRAHHHDHPAIGGAVENSKDQSTLDWAVYFYDYGRYMPPIAKGVAGVLSGANISYKRQTLLALQKNYEQGFFETEIHHALQQSGHSLCSEPAVIVQHFKHYAISRLLPDMYHHGRIYGGQRGKGVSAGERFARGLITPLLPLVICGRTVALVLSKGRNIRPLLTCLPFLFLIAIFWAWGEGCGYFFGTGKSANHWK